MAASPRSAPHAPPPGALPPPTPGATVSAALSWARAALGQAGVPSPELDALLLLTDALQTGKASLLAHPERALAADAAARFSGLVARRAERVPLAYLLGAREFYGRDFVVTPDVLVPRPETELLVELALDYLRQQPATVWATDVGTGSGALAVTLAAERPGLRVVATDRSPAALTVAATNAARHGVAGRVHLVRGDLLGGVAGPLGLIVANLPYIPSAAIDGLMPEVARYEPRLALDGGPDGLGLNRRLLTQARTLLAPDSLLLLEIGSDQGPALRAEAARLFPGADVAVVKDLAGHDRALRVRLRTRGSGMDHMSQQPPSGPTQHSALSAQPSSPQAALSPQRFAWPGDAAAQAPILATAVEALRRGDLVVLPTDTVYGLAAHPDLPDAIARVYAVKERPAEKALPLLVESAAQAATVCEVSPLAERLMARFWPGGLTLVLAARRQSGTLALRMPDHPVPLALIRALGAPLATTSANRSGQPSCTTAAAVQAQLPTGYAVLIDAGPSPGGRDSTVLDLTSSPPRILRPGALAAAELAALTGPLAEP